MFKKYINRVLERVEWQLFLVGKKLFYYKINKTCNVPILFETDVCFKAQSLLPVTNSELLESPRYRRRELNTQIPATENL